MPGGSGSFRTMPPPGSMANILFCPISCNAIDKGLGSWQPFSEFVDRSLPNFVLMMGDQLYMDEDKPDTFDDELDFIAGAAARGDGREVPPQLVARPGQPGARECAHVHDVGRPRHLRRLGLIGRNSPTLVAKHPKGAEIYAALNAYFEDARDVYWHFQGCHNPQPGDDAADPAFPNYVSEPPLHGTAAGDAVCRSAAGAWPCWSSTAAATVTSSVTSCRRSARAVGVHRARLRQHASRRRSTCGRHADADRLDGPGRAGDEARRRPYGRR